jgi:hypothetical protein
MALKLLLVPRLTRHLDILANKAFSVQLDQDVEICVPYSEAVHVGEIGHVTCIRSGGPFSYQVFTTNLGGYNVVEGYADCNDSPAKMPSEYGPPNDGVNGFPGLSFLPD